MTIAPYPPYFPPIVFLPSVWYLFLSVVSAFILVFLLSLSLYLHTITYGECIQYIWYAKGRGGTGRGGTGLWFWGIMARWKKIPLLRANMRKATGYWGGWRWSVYCEHCALIILHCFLPQKEIYLLQYPLSSLDISSRVCNCDRHLIPHTNSEGDDISWILVTMCFCSVAYFLDF
jgi:hypothetical protein